MTSADTSQLTSRARRKARAAAKPEASPGENEGLAAFSALADADTIAGLPVGRSSERKDSEVIDRLRSELLRRAQAAQVPLGQP